MKKWSLLSLLLTALLVITAWELGHRLQVAGGQLPGPGQVALVFVSPEIMLIADAAYQTLSLVTLALLIGGFVGYGLGIMLGYFSPYLRGPYHGINAIKSTPVTVLIPVFLSFFGLKQFLLPLLILPVTAIMAANIAEAVVSTNNNRKSIVSLYGVGGLSYVRRVLVHELAEPVFATLRVVVPFAIALEVAIDYFLSINKGLGAFIYSAYVSPEGKPEMYAGIVTVASIGIGAVKILDALSRKTLIWKRDM